MRNTKEETIQETIHRLKPYLFSELESLLDTAKNGGYICPSCGSGSGQNGTSAISVYEESLKYHCHKCGRGGDIVDLAKAVKGLTTTEAIDYLAQKYLGASTLPAPPPKVVKMPNTANLPKLETRPYLDSAYNAYKGSAGERYIKERGISETTARKYGLGYDVRAGRVIIPTANGSYVARSIKDESPKYKASAGKRELFNVEALKTSGAVFVVEGEIDALSICEAGYNAIGLGGIAQGKKLVEVLQGLDASPLLILALDNDSDTTKGAKAQAELAEALTKAKYKPFKALEAVGGVHPLYNTAKDANEALTTAREAFIARVGRVVASIDEERAEAQIKPVGDRIHAIADKMRESAKVIPIELKCFADALPRGGFTKGLYLLGASPAMGKSALCQQIADDVAKAGHKVLYFSLEMGEDELLLRSIVRTNAERGESMPQAEAERRFLNGETSLLPHWLNNVYIEDFSLLPPTLESIKAVFERFIALNHAKTPLVVVDYLQYIQLADKRENADTVTKLQTVALELRRLSYKCPFLVISSLNREGRKEDKPRLESFQGSGSLEYSANWAGILWNAEESDTPPPAKGKKRVALHCVKVRAGMARNTMLSFVGREYRFEDVDEDLKKPEYKRVKKSGKLPF